MEVKDKILAKASELYLSLGVRNVTMDTLASELDISKRTIYELFNDKDDLVIQCIRYMIMEQGRQHIEMIQASENVIDALFRILRMQEDQRKSYPKVFIEDIKKYFPSVFSAFYTCKADLKKYSASYALLERGVKEGIFRTDLRIELVDTFIHETITILHTSERIHVLRPSPKDIFLNTFLPYLRGISTEKGLGLIEQYSYCYFNNLISDES
ncbi:MAG TPA: TetR/AcrR family transcriptional regulator [Bacteroidales bacterium]|nr:TetR/AcrR family transcriptional regulator [Bacteroidales bacterium]HRZ48243.1 TetR/AcrR family transcriptional regulator [Bacteroidales bacterium]